MPFVKKLRSECPVKIKAHMKSLPVMLLCKQSRSITSGPTCVTAPSIAIPVSFVPQCPYFSFFLSQKNMSTSNYALRMARLSNRIFGEVARPTAETSMRVVKMFSKKPLARDPFVTEYYPNHPQLTGLMIRLRNLGLYR